jgi:hypothetical protein
VSEYNSRWNAEVRERVRRVERIVSSLDFDPAAASVLELLRTHSQEEFLYRRAGKLLHAARRLDFLSRHLRDEGNHAHVLVRAYRAILELMLAVLASLVETGAKYARTMPECAMGQSLWNALGAMETAVDSQLGAHDLTELVRQLNHATGGIGVFIDAFRGETGLSSALGCYQEALAVAEFLVDQQGISTAEVARSRPTRSASA